MATSSVTATGRRAIDRAEHRLAVPPDRVETGREPALHEQDKWLAVLAANRAQESDEQRRLLRRRTLSSQARCRLRSIYEKSGMSPPAMVMACVSPEWADATTAMHQRRLRMFPSRATL